MAEETVLIRFKSEDDATKTTQAVNDGLDNVAKNAGKAGSSFTGMGSVMNGVLQGVGQALGGFALQLGGKALSAVTDFISGSIEEASQWDSAFAQTEAVIKSTGGAAQLTATQIGDMASAMSASAGASLFSDDAILGADNVLATFTQIKGANFSGATQAILDISQAMGTDLNSSALQVGKALNDPVAGISALTRVGVTFTDEQKAMIKAMTETGDVAGAQQVILAELNKEFGGSAAAAVDTYAGQQVVLKEKFADIQQTLGEALMPVLMQFGTFMADTVVPIVASAVEGLSGWIASMNEAGTTSGVFDTIRGAIAAVPGVLAQLSAGLATVQTFLQPLTDAFISWAAVVVPAITSAGGAIAEYLGSPTMQGYISTLTTMLGAMATLIRDVLVLAFNASAVAWTLLSQAFTVAWPYIKTVLDTFYSMVTIGMETVTGILTALSQLVKGDFTGAWTTMKTTVGTALTDIMTFISGLQTKVSGFLSDMLTKFESIGTNIAQGIANGISNAAGKIATAARNAAQAAYDAAAKFLGIASPSTLMRDMVGKNFSLGMAQGITAGIPAVVTAAKDTASSAAATVNNYSFTANYANTQSESSLINDARAWMMTLGAE
ncbi:hypothetical protein UFOVP698_31 [uncultured Caudovirales phage]|uniref:Uncharacterized protein n=1 Tax=uncultured Caudovirales phage TaxID=2100421 RepID=A0A6J5NJ78_9CAUD|nr:hypothetical protein UFOVP698_31 [uncultured Caudovirales phage]